MLFRSLERAMAEEVPAEEEEEKEIEILGGGIQASEEREEMSRAIREANQQAAEVAAKEEAATTSGGGALQGFFSFLLFSVIAVLIWLVLNILMYAGVIPKMDFGYQWFNENVFPMFWV